MLEELRKAKHFIFLEYFIITEGQMWDGILEILEEKAAQGFDVRVMYDDMGFFMTLSAGYAKRLEKKGVKCVSFNRISPVLNAVMNHRDHRKIMVIDGKTAFSGGVRARVRNAGRLYRALRGNAVRSGNRRAKYLP